MPVRPSKVPAPIGGWNTRDPVSSMSPTDAIVMNNVVVDTDGVAVRPGYVEYVNHSGDGVQRLISWETQFGERLISSDNTGSNHRLFDVSTATASTIATGFMRSTWDSTVFNGSLGLVNGGDTPRKLDYSPGSGVTISRMVIGGISQPQRLSVIHAHKERSYFATGDEPAFWYSATEALGGNLARFPIDRVSSTGGNVIGISTWSRDGGGGPDDFFVLFLNTGEVIVYSGSDPSDANDWSIVGRYSMGRILAYTEFFGKIHVVTEEDYNIVPDDLLTQGLKTPTKLSGAARDAVRKYGGDWQITIDPASGFRIINIPSRDREQHILNMRTGSASRWTIGANCWGRYGGDIFFGGKDGKVYKLVDNTDDAGTAIEWAIQQGFSDFRSPMEKNIPNYRPVWTVNGTFSYASGLAFDYNPRDFIQTVTTSSDGPDWDTTDWDTSLWGSGDPQKLDWLVGNGRGQSVSLVQNGSSTRRAVFHHTDYRIEESNDTL